MLSQETFSQLITAQSKGIISEIEVRQWLKPDETLEDSQKAIDEIRATSQTVEDMFGTINEN